MSADTEPTDARQTATTPQGARPSGSEAYRSQAGHYDQRTDAFRNWRALLVALLPVQRGGTVLDVGCGTGLCMSLLQDKIGPTGTIVGIDESEQMLEVAAARVAERGWDNVNLIAAPVATAPIDALGDAALFCAVHDVMQSPAAMGNVFDHLRPGAPVAAAGGKQPGPWMWPLRPWVADLHAPFITDFTGFDKHGGSCPSSPRTCGYRSSPSARDTSPSATPRTADRTRRRQTTARHVRTTTRRTNMS